MERMEDMKARVTGLCKQQMNDILKQRQEKNKYDRTTISSFIREAIESAVRLEWRTPTVASDQMTIDQALTPTTEKPAEPQQKKRKKIDHTKTPAAKKYQARYKLKTPKPRTTKRKAA